MCADSDQEFSGGGLRNRGGKDSGAEAEHVGGRGSTQDLCDNFVTSVIVEAHVDTIVETAIASFTVAATVGVESHGAENPFQWSVTFRCGTWVVSTILCN
jgi:hypothetical protein